MCFVVKPSFRASTRRANLGEFLAEDGPRIGTEEPFAAIRQGNFKRGHRVRNRECCKHHWLPPTSSPGRSGERITSASIFVEPGKRVQGNLSSLFAGGIKKQAGTNRTPVSCPPPSVLHSPPPSPPSTVSDKMVRPTRMLRQAAQAVSRQPHPALSLSHAVRAALTPSTKAPVVALESTIITHGLPYPLNLEVAQELEQTVIDNGAVPATVALLDGRALIGTDQQQLERLAQCAIDQTKNTPIKASRRDIAHVLAKGKGTVGGTTVSGTMVLAHLAGIQIFATGGIGGVHRGAESTMDISADLTELGRTPVAVFCSGPKSILDIPRTLEVLETYGVSVTTFNSTGEFPAFYTSNSGLYVPYAGSDAQAAASIFANAQLGIQSGQVFANPIPAQWNDVGAKIQKCVEQAVHESIQQGIDKKGKEVTPWLLKRLAELIPESKKSNRALVVNNAKKAAQVAVELHKIEKEVQQAGNTYALGALQSTVS